jgi:cell division septation protein DedD
VKKISFFCLYCVILTLIPAVSILAQGGKDDSRSKPFPALEVPVDESETYYLSEIIDEDDESSLASETTAVSDDEMPITPETTAVNEGRQPVTPEITGVNDSNPSPVPEKTAVSDRNSRGSADAESAAVTAAPAPPPPAVQPPPAPSRAPPPQQPPVRTIAPTVNVIVPPAAPPAAAPAAPPAYRPSMNVTPGMPNPSGNGVYRVQVGAFSNTGNAQQCFNRLKSAGFTPFYEQYGSLYRVVLTGIQAADMAGVIRRLEAAGFREAWIREER